MSYLDLPIAEIHKAIIEGKVAPIDLVKESLQRAKNDDNNAFEYICEKEAIESVANLKDSQKSSLFYGIPFVLKDNYSTKNIPTTASSNILNNYVPIFDSEVGKRLIDAGAILIGKTTMDELAMGGSGTTGHKGISYNPWDKNHEHLIGGSSCGSAIAACNNIVPLAIGSDTGDSVRKPASNGGLVGLKPTWGRISRFGLFPFAPSLDHVGFFTRNVEDSALTCSLLEGRDDKDATSSFKPGVNYINSINKGVNGKKIAVISGVVNAIKDKKLIEVFNNTLENLEKGGATINYVDVDDDLLKAIYPTYIIISCAEATSNNANLDGIKFGNRKPGNTYEEIMINTRTEGFSELIKRRFVIGSYSLLKENQNELFVRAQKCRRLIVDAINNILKDYDGIFMPASPTTAPNVKTSASDKLSDEYLIADNYMAIGNFGGYPSITVPLGFVNDMPIGGNLTCKPFDEENMFQIALAIENGTGLKNLSAKEGR